MSAKSMRPRLFKALVLAAVAGPFVSANPVQELGLSEWIQRALPNHHAIRQADIDLLYRARRAQHNGQWEDPQLRLSTEDRQDRGDQEEIRLRIPVPNPWLAASRRHQLRAAEELAANGRQLALMEAYGDLKGQYLEALYRQEELRSAEEVREQLAAEEGNAERMRAAGLLTDAEWIEIRGEIAEAALRRSDALMRSEEASARLSLLGGFPFDRVFILDPAVLPPPGADVTLPELAELQREALADNPAINQLALIRELQRAEASEERARGRPAIDYIQGSWTREADRGRDDWTVSVQFVLPVFSFFRQRAVAEARLDRAEADEALQRETIVRSLRMAHVRAVAARDDLLRKSRAVTGLLGDMDSLMESRPPSSPKERIRQWKSRSKLERELLQARFELCRALLDLEALRGLNQPGMAIELLTPPAPPNS